MMNLKKSFIFSIVILVVSGIYAQEVKNGVLKIAEGTERIEENAYEGRKDIVKVICPSSLKSIGAFAFKNCKSLSSVTFNEGLTSIGYESFANCKAISSVKIPNTVEKILSRAFTGTSIQKINLPESVNFVDANSFPNGVVPYDISYGMQLKPIDVDMKFPTHPMPDDKYIVKKENARVVNMDCPAIIYVNPLEGNKGNDGYAYTCIDLPVWNRDYQYIIEILGAGASNYEIGTRASGAKYIRAVVGPVAIEDSYMVVIRFKLMQIPLEYNNYLSNKFPAKYKPYEEFMTLPSPAAGGCNSDHPYFQNLAAEFKKKTLSPPELAKRAFIYPWHHLYFSESCVTKDPAWALLIGEGDCTEFSGLFVTISRACGIPARQISVSTFDQYEPRVVTSTNHSLSEVYMEPVGWFAVDANLGGGSLVGKHRFGYIPVLQIYDRPEDYNYTCYPYLNGDNGNKFGSSFVAQKVVYVCDTGEPHEINERNKRKKNANLIKNKGYKRIPPVENYTDEQALKNLYANKFVSPYPEEMVIKVNRLSPYESNHGMMKEYAEQAWIDSFNPSSKPKAEPAKEGLIDGVLYIKEGTTEIFPRKYFRNSSIKKVVIPSSVVKIDEYAFTLCNNLAEVEIPSSVKFIGESAFENCVFLKKITMHEGLETIGNKAFKNTAVTEVSIPKSVKSIGDEAFALCPLKK